MVMTGSPSSAGPQSDHSLTTSRRNPFHKLTGNLTRSVLPAVLMARLFGLRWSGFPGKDAANQPEKSDSFLVTLWLLSKHRFWKVSSGQKKTGCVRPESSDLSDHPENVA